MNCLQQILKSFVSATLLISLALPASVFASSERARISQQQLSVEITETLQEYRKHKTFGELQKFLSTRVSANARKEIERRIGTHRSDRLPAATQQGDTIVFVNIEVPVTLRIVDPEKNVVEVNHTLVTLSDDFVKDMRNLEAALPRKHTSNFSFHLIEEAQAQSDTERKVLFSIGIGVFLLRAISEAFMHYHAQESVNITTRYCTELEASLKNTKQKIDPKDCDTVRDANAAVKKTLLTASVAVTNHGTLG